MSQCTKQYHENGTFTVETENDSMAQKRAPKIDESKLGGNPYQYTLVIPVTEVTKMDVDDDMEGLVVDKVFYWERTLKTSLYRHESARSNVCKLSDKAQRMYLHILYTIEANKDYLYMNKTFYMKENEIRSLSTYYESIRELIRYEYIQKTNVPEVYWINPHRFFAGNRAKKYPDRIVVEERFDKRQGKYTKKAANKKEPFSWNKNVDDEQSNQEQ